ncbi:hypothetical protein [Paraclostridium bifermentans]|uniref:hypothetical protein n=1 Tax=Paraclostridium bifermentans TaxID=1490 RepID=UPI00359C5DF4
MKKVIISSLMVIFLTGCTQTNVYIDENDKNNDINKNQKVEENIDKDSNKDNIDKTIESIVYIDKVYYKTDEDIEDLKSKVKDKTIYVYAKNKDNVLLLIQTNTHIKDIRVHTLGEEFYNENFDIDKYLEKYYDLNYNNLDNISLDKNSALLIRIHEPETIPMYCISWVNEKNEKKYYLLSYGFDENLNEIQRESIEIK